MYRREALAAGSVGVVGALAGCLDLILGDESTFEAAPAIVNDEAVATSGYEHRETWPIEESEDFFGHTVRVTNWATEYEREVGIEGMEEAETAVFGLLTSPEASVAGRDFNPIDDMDTSEIVEMVQGEYDDVQVGDQVEERTVETLDEDVTIDTFEGTASMAGDVGVDVFFDVGRTKVETDHVVILGVYPDVPTDNFAYGPMGERDRVTTLIEGIEHDPDEADIPAENEEE